MEDGPSSSSPHLSSELEPRSNGVQGDHGAEVPLLELSGDPSTVETGLRATTSNEEDDVPKTNATPAESPSSNAPLPAAKEKNDEKKVESAERDSPVEGTAGGGNGTDDGHGNAPKSTVHEVNTPAHRKDTLAENGEDGEKVKLNGHGASVEETASGRRAEDTSSGDAAEGKPGDAPVKRRVSGAGTFAGDDDPASPEKPKKAPHSVSFIQDPGGQSDRSDGVRSGMLGKREQEKQDLLTDMLRKRAQMYRDLREGKGDLGARGRVEDTYVGLNSEAVTVKAFDAAYKEKQKRTDLRRGRRVSTAVDTTGGGSGDDGGGDDASASEYEMSTEESADEEELKFWMRRKDRNRDIPNEERAIRAALYIDDAVNGRPIRIHRLSKWPTKAYRFFHWRVWRRFILLIVYLHLCLAFTESASTNIGRVSTGQRLGFLLLELFFVLIYAFDISILLYGEGVKHFCHNASAWRLLQFVSILAFTADVIVALMLRVSFRFSRFLRPMLIVVHSKDVRNLVHGIVRSVLQGVDIILLLIIIIFTFGIMGVQTFGINDFSEGEARNVYREEGGPTDQNFDNLAEAALTLFVLLTTESYPDVMYPAMRLSPFYAGYFIIFILLGVYILLAVLTAIIFDTYKEEHEKRVVAERIEERKGLIAAFQVMDLEDSGRINLNQWLDLALAYKPGIDADSALALFAAMDTDHTWTLTLVEFFDILAVLMFDLTEVKTQHRCRALCGCARTETAEEGAPKACPARTRRRMRAAINSRAYELFSVSVIMLNIIELMFYHYGMSKELDRALFIADMVFLSFYTLELLMKVAVFGPRDFWEDRFNRFDCFLVVGSLGGLLFQTAWLPRVVNPSIFTPLKMVRLFKALRFVRLFRSFRILRILGAESRFRILTNAFVQVGWAMVSVSQYLLVWFYMFAILGMELFAGSFDRDPMHDPKATFNDFPSALLTLFQIFTTSNWHEIMYVARRTTSGWAALYFVSFFCIMNIFSTTILLAIIFEIFSVQRRVIEESKQRKKIRFHNKELKVRKRTHSRWDHAMVEDNLGAYEMEELAALNTNAGVDLQQQMRQRKESTAVLHDEYLNNLVSHQTAEHEDVRQRAREYVQKQRNSGRKSSISLRGRRSSRASTGEKSQT